ncbi:uncharacterized protein LOC144212124 [Stigmatopora nigra]
MDGQGDGWHNGPNSIRLPLPRGLRPPNDEPNMEFIAILDFIVNQEIIFVNEPERWDLDDNNQNNHPIHINNLNVQDNVFIGPIIDNVLVNQPRVAAPAPVLVGALSQMDVNQRLEAVENLPDQSNDDQIISNGQTRSALENTSESDEDVDEANKEPQPGPSQQRSEGSDDNRTQRDTHFLWWHEFHQKSSENSPEFDFYEVNPLLSESNQSLDSVEEKEEMESRPPGEFSMIGQCLNDLSRSIINSDPADIVSDCEERLKDFIGLEDAQDESRLDSFSDSSTCRHGSERGSDQFFQWDNLTTDKTNDQDHLEENSPTCGSDQDDLDSEQSTLGVPNEFSDLVEQECQDSSSKKDNVSSDEDPLPGTSSWMSNDNDGHNSDTLSGNRLRWWHEFCPHSSDSSTDDVEDPEGVLLPGASRKRCGCEDEEGFETRISKRFRFGCEGISDEATDGEETEEEFKGLSENLHPDDTKGKKRLRLRADVCVNHEFSSSSSTCIETCHQEIVASFSDQEKEEDSQKESLLQIEKGCDKDLQVGHLNSSEDIDSGGAEAQPLKLSLGDNLALLSLSSHLSQRKLKIVRFQEETTSQDSDPEANEDILALQPQETLNEDGNTSDK